jgi:hypothetical protein
MLEGEMTSILVDTEKERGQGMPVLGSVDDVQCAWRSDEGGESAADPDNVSLRGQCTQQTKEKVK